MKYLIIYAHPNIESHARITLQEIESRLKELKRDYEVIDLYKIKFDPTLSADEMTNRDPEKIDKQIKEFQNKITDAKILIFIYPIWWNGMPAMMKGFIDRVFSAGFAFKYYGHIPRQLLRGKKAIVFATTGTSKLLSCLFLGNRWKTVVVRDNLGFFGIKAKVYHIDNAYRLTDANKEKIKKNVLKAFK